MTTSRARCTWCISRCISGNAFDITATGLHNSSGPRKVIPDDMSTNSPSAVKQATKAFRSSCSASDTWYRCRTSCSLFAAIAVPPQPVLPNHPIRLHERPLGNCQADLLRRFKIDYELELHRLLDR